MDDESAYQIDVQAGFMKQSLFYTLKFNVGFTHHVDAQGDYEDSATFNLRYTGEGSENMFRPYIDLSYGHELFPEQGDVGFMFKLGFETW